MLRGYVVEISVFLSGYTQILGSTIACRSHYAHDYSVLQSDGVRTVTVDIHQVRVHMLRPFCMQRHRQTVHFCGQVELVAVQAVFPLLRPVHSSLKTYLICAADKTFAHGTSHSPGPTL